MCIVSVRNMDLLSVAPEATCSALRMLLDSIDRLYRCQRFSILLNRCRKTQIPALRKHIEVYSSLAWRLQCFKDLDRRPS